MRRVSGRVGEEGERTHPIFQFFEKFEYFNTNEFIEWTGRSSLSVVQRYAHLGSRHKKQEIERITEKFHNVFHNNISPLPFLPLKKDA